MGHAWGQAPMMLSIGMACVRARTSRASWVGSAGSLPGCPLPPFHHSCPPRPPPPLLALHAVEQAALQLAVEAEPRLLLATEPPAASQQQPLTLAMAQEAKYALFFLCGLARLSGQVCRQAGDLAATSSGGCAVAA